MRLLVTTNVDHVVNLQRCSALRRAYTRAWLATIDGAPVYVYAKLRGLGVPERVTGADLFLQILSRLHATATLPFFVASSHETATGIRNLLIKAGMEPRRIGTAVPPFGFECDQKYSEILASRIRQHGTTHLFMGIGCPKSEVWVDTHAERLGNLYAFGFGAALDFAVGTKRRAPNWVQRVGMEWAWRLGMEPRRLAPRYLANSWRFGLMVLRDLRSDG